MLAFSRAITGLRIAEQNLYVTSNNLSNVETEGYHRQRLDQYAFSNGSSNGYQVGLGVDADTIRQVRSEFLETNYRNELASFGEFEYKDKVYASIQAIVGNNGSAVQDCINDLWESFNELTKEYTITVAGGYLRENAVSFIEELDSINEQLDKMQNELDTEVDNIVKQINDYSRQIASLNDQINRSEADGSLSCELRDSRDSVIAALSELVDISVEHATNTCVNIRTSNGYLVVRNDYNRLSTGQITPQSTFSSPIWEETGEEFEVNSGVLKGLIDMRGEVGNLESSSNGNPKEKMDIVVSIDTDMNHKSIDDMIRNLTGMMDTLDRQSANYQFYLTDGTKVKKEDLNNFMEYLYIASAEKEIREYVDNNPGASVSELKDYLKDNFGADSKIIEDVFNYLENLQNNAKNFSDFKTYLADNGLNSETINEYIAEFEKNEGKTLDEFNSFLESKKNSEALIELKGYLNDYIDENVTLDADDITNYITGLYDTTDRNTITNMINSNSGNVLRDVVKATIVDFRPDSNKYMMVFTDSGINNPVTIKNVGQMMKEADMRLLAVTNEEVATDWRDLAQYSNGNVFDITDFETADRAEDLALDITRDFNSRLIGSDSGSGIAFFRAGLNSVLNGFAKEINAVFRQGMNIYEERHGIVKDKDGNIVYDDKTGEPKFNNFDLFVKIDEDLPLQMGNVKINPIYSDLNKMPLSLTGDTGDFRIGNMLVDLGTLDIFNSGDEYSTLDEHYASFILDFSQAANEATTMYESQQTVLTVANEKIQTISGVSMDEELSNMLKFQYSYTAASKMINVIDEMLQTIIQM